MTQVRLLPGSMFHDAQDWNLGYMGRLGADRLVYNFRYNAGLPLGSVKPFAGQGNWERPGDGTRGTELRGHFTGHFLSASALAYASTGDNAIKAKGDEIVAELAKVQQKLGQGGYLSAFPTELFDRLSALHEPGRTPPERGSGGPQLPWAPFYTIHKIMAGMLDMHQLAGNQEALKVVEGMADWADKYTASKSEEHMQNILLTEYGGMAEVLYNLAAVTNNDQWAKAGDRFTKKWFFNPLALQRDELNKDPRGFPLHVNTHIPQVIGAARRYEISGDMRFHDVASYFFHAVSTGHSYVTTGTSNGESWQGPARHLAWELKRSVATAECCCSYNMLKLARHLYGWNGDPRYFDYYERALLNHRIGTIHPKNGYTQYYLSMTPGAWKTFNTEDQNFWCCTGTGVEEYSKLNDSIYWHDQEGVYVNLFIPSELNWKEKGFRLKQETKFPEQQSTTLTVSVDRPTQMPLRLRIPAWIASSSVKVNGKAVDASASGGSYLVLNRSWKNGDKIEMALPMQHSVEAMPDDPKMVAFLYGPLVLAGDLGNEGLTEQMIYGTNAPRMQRMPIEVPTLQEAGGVKPADAPLRFRLAARQREVALLPINSLFDRRYTIYWTVA
jgi:hypothetical protein